MCRRLLLACVLVFSGPALAEDEETAPDNRVTLDSLFALRSNPAGSAESLYLSYRRKLSNSDHVLLQDTFASVGPTVSLTPGFATTGVQAKVQPLAVLAFRGAYEFYGSFGTAGQIRQFESLDEDYSDPALKARGPGTKRIGGILSLEGLVQAKLGPVAVRNTFVGRHFNIRSDDAQVAFYDQTTDLLAPTLGWVWTDDVDLLALLPRGLTAGARWTTAQALHGTTGQASETISRVGPLVALTFFQRPGAAFNVPTVLLISQWNVKHPYRAGEVSSAALPTLTLGFAFSGDLIPW